MDAIILAGGAIPADLQSLPAAAISSPSHGERALLSVQERPVIAWIIDSLQGISEIERISVIGEPHTLEILPQISSQARGLAARDKLSANVLLGLDAAESEQVLIITCDIPLVTQATWRQFLEGARAKKLQAAYPIIRDSIIERDFPGGKRTYGTLREGRFTGGNAFLLPASCRDILAQVLETAYGARKNPLKLASFLGIGFIVKVLLRRLTIHDAETKISDLLQCRAGAVEMEDAAIAFDLDKEEDYRVIKSTFAKRGKMGIGK